MQTKSPSANLSESTIQRALGEFGLVVSSEQVLKIQQYIRILLAWNEKVNVTAIQDPLEILNRHFCESMFGSKYLPVENCRLADVGSGGGFPGLPIKILRPDVHLFLIESNFKKATFLAEVLRELETENARVLVSRYEELGEEIAPLDVACSRALGEFQKFLEWADSPAVACPQVMFWVGARDLDEIRANKLWKWDEPVPVPNSLRRYLLIGRRAK